MQGDIFFAVVDTHHWACTNSLNVCLCVLQQYFFALQALPLSSVTSRCVFEWWCFEAGQTDARRQIAYARAPTTNLFSRWEVIDARANFKLCELNSCYQRQWWVTGAQLEGLDKTCTHLCLHAFSALSTAAFNNDGRVNDWSDWVGGLWCCRYHWGPARCHVQQLDKKKQKKTSNMTNVLTVLQEMNW